MIIQNFSSIIQTIRLPSTFQSSIKRLASVAIAWASLCCDTFEILDLTDRFSNEDRKLRLSAFRWLVIRN